ncbi:MAG: hypothetical protein ACRD01_03915 [Terriglobales bacterium]
MSAANQDFRQYLAGAPPAWGPFRRETARSLEHNPKFSNPYFWAPFILTGNWQ